MEDASRRALLWKGLLWLIWLGYVGALTRALLMEYPDPREGGLIAHAQVRADPIHVLVYALFAVLSAALRVPRPYRWGLILFMSAHGCFTEYFQRYLQTRYASWTDVGLDHIGILVGVGITWPWWRKP